MPPKKEKKQRDGRSKYVLPLKGTKGVILGLMRIDHSAKQKTQAVYPDILLVLIVELAKI